MEFDLENTLNGNPIYKHFGKTIVFIVIDINKTKADSTLGKADFYKVTETDLLKEVETLTKY
ncbi:MAG: hypothetical protein K1X72_21605 [Pyrinomonadaceae bacterium]|nr:hypothetical protein [Pyrinomonadaceae bacterium]